MRTSRHYQYKLLMLPNHLAEFFIKSLSYLRFGYCKIVWAGPNELFYSRPQHIVRLAWLKENIQGRTIEIGCSTGYITGTFNLDVGLDLDIKRLRRAKWFRYDNNFVCADASKLPFSKNEFDTVILSEILEHVPFHIAQAIIQEACRIGKQVLITIPKLPKYLENPEHLWIPTTEDKMHELIGARDFELTRSPDEDYFWVKLSPTPITQTISYSTP